MFPIRVLHRRSYATREKLVLNMRVEREGLKDNMFKLLSRWSNLLSVTVSQTRGP
jgi:hypothetical protein